MTLPANVAGGTSTVYNVDNEQTKFNATSHVFDAAGNMTSDGTNTYTFDARSHLTAISGGVAATFVYDAFGRRMKKTIGSTTQFLYDGLNPVQELNSSNQAVANLLTGLHIDEFFTRKDSSNNVSTLLTDALGSTIGLVGSGQSIATSYTYQPFGATTIGGTANASSYEFTGRENDGTGLYFYRARYYSPTFQRFASQDPIGFRGGDANLYAYTRNGPGRFRDPLGLWTVAIGFGGGSEVGTLGGAGGFVGIVVDGHGNVGIIVTEGGGLAGMSGGDMAAGGPTIQISNAETICDLRGKFVDFTIGGGAEVGAIGSVFASLDGSVAGVSLTGGDGFGAGYGINFTDTQVGVIGTAR